MNWDGRIGPGFIVILGLALLQGVSWATDGKAALSERMAVMETQLKWIVGSVARLEGRTDPATVFKPYGK